MPAYLEEKPRRIKQFTDYLRLMGLRTRKLVKDDCFVVFSESPSEDADAQRLAESVAMRASCSTATGTGAEDQSFEETVRADNRAGESSDRHIQFAFM